MRKDMAVRLRQLLAKLSIRQAIAVARGIETERALGRETLPTETILAALRPQLRQAEAERVPTLKRLACAGFEDFLADRGDDPRPPGIIARSVLEPWWQALAIVAGPGLEGFGAELRELVAADDTAGIAALAERLARAARGWTETIIARLGEPAEAALAPLFRDPLLRLDLQEIACVLPLGGAVRKGLDAVIRAAGGNDAAQGRRITELGPAAVSEAAHQHRRLSGALGTDVRYFTLGLLNKLERAWSILRLGRALAWKLDDAPAPDSEYGIIAGRLVADLQRQAREIGALAARRDVIGELKPLVAQLAGYVEDAEGLLGEFGFRRGSVWGEAILATRGEVAQAVGGTLVIGAGDAVLAVLPQTRRQGFRRVLAVPDLAAMPDHATVARACEAARFLAFLLRHGERHGFGAAALDMAARLAEEIERRSAQLIAELRNAADSAVIPAQLAAAIEVSDILFDDGRGELLARRVRSAQQAHAGGQGLRQGR